MQLALEKVLLETRIPCEAYVVDLCDSKYALFQADDYQMTHQNTKTVTEFKHLLNVHTGNTITGKKMGPVSELDLTELNQFQSEFAILSSEPSGADFKTSLEFKVLHAVKRLNKAIMLHSKDSALILIHYPEFPTTLRNSARQQLLKVMMNGLPEALIIRGCGDRTLAAYL